VINTNQNEGTTIDMFQAWIQKTFSPLRKPNK